MEKNILNSDREIARRTSLVKVSYPDNGSLRKRHKEEKRMGDRAKVLNWCTLAFLSVASLAAPRNDHRLVDAVKNKDVEAVHSLMKQHVDVNMPHEDGATA